MIRLTHRFSVCFLSSPLPGVGRWGLIGRLEGTTIGSVQLCALSVRVVRDGAFTMIDAGSHRHSRKTAAASIITSINLRPSAASEPDAATE